jgi:Glu-tRNA(Gln) amidotransferase subunit E-like FAD-binding protein
MENWIWVFIGVSIVILVDAISKINKKLDEVIKRQNEIEENVLEEVRDCGIDKNQEYDPSSGSM